MSWEELLAKEQIREKGRIATLAHEQSIKRKLGEGYSVKSIWRALKAADAMPVGYAAFNAQVKKLLPSENQRSQASRVRNQKEKSASSSFEFDPQANKDSLI